jgi:hypothetical protein
MAENQYTPIQQTEAEITFHDTIQRRQPPSPSTSVISQIQEPTTLLPSTVDIPPIMTSITIGGITIEVESTEQVRTDKILESLASGTNAVTSRYLNTTAQFGSCHQGSHNSPHTIHLVRNIAYPTE